MACAAFMTKRYEVFDVGLMRLKTRRARVLTAVMAAAKDSDGGIDMAEPAAADAAYDEYGYGLHDAGRVAGPAWSARSI